MTDPLLETLKEAYKEQLKATKAINDELIALRVELNYTKQSYGDLRQAFQAYKVEVKQKFKDRFSGVEQDLTTFQGKLTKMGTWQSNKDGQFSIIYAAIGVISVPLVGLLINALRG